MELIANLERSQNSTRGLTPENLENLERIFKDAVGDKQEIDLENFKNIVQSKNMFFVERIFNVFDADKSGAVSLEEFMRVMRTFADQSPVEKLHYLFQVYDLNNDGSIEFGELRSVISECMKENGLRFEEEEIDELTRMLFEDADTDNSGTVTFAEFREQLERQPAFMENLTLSIERWLLPPMKPTPNHNLACNFVFLRKKWQHIRNNWTSVVFLILYFFTNLVLFATRACHYADKNIYVVLARACGQCLNFNCAFIVLLVLRQTLTWLRTHGFSQYFPIDQHLYYHKLTGCVILFFSLFHTVMHIANFTEMSSVMQVPVAELLTSTHFGIGWVGGSACLTGWILLVVLVTMGISSMPFVRRNGKFEVFYYLHLLAFIFWICLILHGPSFWKWFLGPAILFIMECAIRVNRNLSSGKLAYVQQGVLLPSKVTHLVIKRPPKFDYRPGDYVYLNIPAIAKFEWHPFTISSAPELDEYIWLHIRGVGEWTNSLHSYFQREDEEAVLSDELAKNLEDLPDFVKNNPNMSHLGQRFSSIGSPSDIGDVKHCSFLSASQTNMSNNFTAPSPIPIANGIGKANNSVSSAFRKALDETFTNPSFCSDNDSNNQTVIEMERSDRTFTLPTTGSLRSSTSTDTKAWKRTSFTSASTSRAIQMKNKEDIRAMLAEHSRNASAMEEVMSNHSRLSLRGFPKRKRKSVRVSVCKRGLRRCQTVIVMPTVNEDEEDEQPKMEKELQPTEEEVKDLNRETEVENVIISPEPLKVFLDGPYGSPTRHIFQSRHAVLIGTGIGVTPFASILQSIMYQYRKSKHTCPSCSHKWSDPMPVTSIHLKKVDFFWLNRHQKAFEWFVNLLSELEVEQAQLEAGSRFLDIHMYITSALLRTDMKAVGLQMALDLLYKKEERDLITGLKSRTQPGRPDWNKVFTSIAQQQKGKVTVFFCGPNQLAKTLQAKCDEFGFRFRKECF